MEIGRTADVDQPVVEVHVIALDEELAESGIGAADQ
jgi:hypothetical protein